MRRQTGKSVRNLPQSVLKDHIPSLLEGIVGELRDVADPFSLEQQDEASVGHAVFRAQLPDYSLNEVISELGALRRAIFTILDESGPVDAWSRDRILRAIERAISTSAVTLVERQRASELQAKEQAQRALQRLRGLQHVAEAALVNSLSLQDLLDDLCWRIAVVLNADLVSILLIDRSENVLILRAGYGAEVQAPIRVAVPVGHGFSGSIFATGRGRIVTDLPRAEIYNPVIRDAGLTSIMGVPMGLAAKRTGVVAVGRRAHPPYVDEDLSLLQIIADRIAIAIEQASLSDLSREHTRQLEEERRMREDFVTGLVHDLRGPLMAVALNVDLALRSGVSEAAEHSLERARGTLRNADTLIQDLLDANRLTAGVRLPLEIIPMDLSTRLSEQLESLRASLGGRLVAQIEERVRGYWNPGAIQRIVRNLVDNAFKYGDPQSPVTVRLVHEDGRARITVHNTGAPIPDDQQERIFARFYRVAGAGKRGWGIGLTLVRGLAEAMGGFAGLESTADGGTTFTVDLPLDARPYQE